MSTARIVTDKGKAFCKAMGNRQGPHALACELVGTQLARWFGLRTFDFTILPLDKLDEIPFFGGGRAEPGPAFVTRAEKGHSWGGDAESLDLLDNPADIARLVVFDTWTLNCDRHLADAATPRSNKDNVFFSEEGAAPGRFRLVAMDHTHCFTCGYDLDEHAEAIGRIKDERVYGAFPGFAAMLQSGQDAVRAALAKLREMDGPTATGMASTIPREWDVSDRARSALAQLICQRAKYLADNSEQWVAMICRPGQFPYHEGGTP